MPPLPSPPLAPPRVASPGPRPLAAPPAQALPWTHQLGRRMRHLLLFKIAGVTTFTTAFFWLYFELLRHPVRAVTVMPLTAFDAWLPWQPWALPAYLSLWLYVGIAPGLLGSMRALLTYGGWAAALCATGLLLFWLVPTAVPPQPLPVDLLQHPGFGLLHGVDAAGNACPSMHVAVALFSAVWIDRLLRGAAAPAGLRAAAALWLVLIVHSTLGVKQHVVWDVVAGAALGAVFAWASARWVSPLAVDRIPASPARGT